MLKLIYKQLLFLLLPVTAFAQQNSFNWNAGFYTGSIGYYGELGQDWQSHLSDNIFKIDETHSLLGLQLEGTSEQGAGYRFTAARGVFQSRDWAYNDNGQLVTENDNFARALNARTTFYEYAAQVVLTTDNGKILGKQAFIAPYLAFGAGFSTFEVEGDLLSAEGSRYYYWSDQTVRNLPENSPNSNLANMVQFDGDFETNLGNLREQRDADYNGYTLFIPAEAGLKIRLGYRLSAIVAAQVRFTFTDYLDDVPQDYVFGENPSEFISYVENPSGVSRPDRGDSRNDHYGALIVGLRYHFGRKNRTLQSPVVYTALPLPGLNVSAKDTALVVTDSTLENSVVQTDSLQAPGRKAGMRLALEPGRDTLINNIAGPGETQEEVQVDTKPATETSPPQELAQQDTGNVTEEELLQQAQQPEILVATEPAEESRVKVLEQGRGSAEEQVSRQEAVTPEYVAETAAERQAMAEEIDRLEREIDLLSDAAGTELFSAEEENRLRRATRRLEEQKAVYRRTGRRQFVPVPVPVPGAASNGANRADTVYMMPATATGTDSLQQLTDSTAIANAAAVTGKVSSLESRIAYTEQQLGRQLLQLERKIDSLSRTLQQQPAVATPTVPAPVPAPLAVAAAPLASETVYFGMGVSSLNSGDEAALLKIVEQLEQMPEAYAIVSAATDATGNPDLNTQLALKRASAVRKFLIAQGIQPSRVKIGMLSPDETQNPEQPELSRKAEVRVFESE